MIPFLRKNKDDKKPPKSTVPRTAQESIPFQRMFEDGTCRVRPGYYTRTIQYQDITGGSGNLFRSAEYHFPGERHQL